ncbi:hypothetical protein STSO111631_05815 [Stackebrandtia soli]
MWTLYNLPVRGYEHVECQNLPATRFTARAVA